MHLIALNGEQKDLLIHWLHYLIRKMEFPNAAFKNENAYQGLKSVQEQLLRPKTVEITMDYGNTIATPETIHIDDNKIIINCNE